MRHRSGVGALASALVLGVIATGCGGGTSKVGVTGNGPVGPATSDQTAAAPPGGSGSGSQASACGLLTETDVSTAMKQTMKVSGGAGGVICTYSASADPSVILAVQTYATRNDMALQTQIESSEERLDGLGDAGFWNSTLDSVFVRKGDRGFVVTSPSLASLAKDPQVTKSAMIGLAKIVLGKF
jgi:hypothetical protein